MYAWIWRRLPGRLRTKIGVAAAVVLAVAAVLWYVVFPWLEPKMQLDHGVVDGSPATPTAPATPG